MSGSVIIIDFTPDYTITIDTKARKQIEDFFIRRLNTI